MKYTLKHIIFASFIFTLFLYSAFRIYAQASGNVNATVKISVCGNSIAEGSEDCDLNDLRSNTCATIGYTYGTLTCDISCSFDTSQCVYIPPTPTPTPTITPTPTVTPIVISTPTATPAPTSSIASPTSSTAPAEEATATVTPKEVIRLPSTTPTPRIPINVAFFTPDESGKITNTSIIKSIELWMNVKEYAQQGAIDLKRCDLNSDRKCNLGDISVLLFYVDRF